MSGTQAAKGIERVSAALIAGLDLDTLLAKIAGEAAEVVGAATSLMLWDENKDHLVIKASQGLSDQYIRQQRISREEAQAVFKRVEQEDLFLWPYTQQDPPGRRDLIEGEGIQAILSIPLVAQAELIGLLIICAKERSRQFNRAEGELARIFANLAVAAIQNAERIEELEKIKDREYASQVVAWLGLFGADWQHTIHQKTFSIDNFVEGLRYWLARQSLPVEVTAKAEEGLNGITDATENI
ncbi:MAG TPA: GAF domain-containing protein, partial [Anaerolineae bacterium]